MLHIHNGDETAGTARKSNIPGEHLTWREALVCGPAPGGLSEDQFRQVRAKHLSEAYELNLEDCEKQLREQAEGLAKFRDHEEVVLWFEHDLFCQIHLVYLLNWFAEHEPGKTRLSLVCIGEFPGIADFRGLGQLTEDQLASLLRPRIEITGAHLDLGARAWSAYCSPDPNTLAALLESDTSALPFLRNALLKHLPRFPSVRNGLGRIENLGLELIASGQNGFKDLFPKFGRIEPTYGFGDAQFYLELKRLATAPEPLLTISSAATAGAMDSGALLDSSFQITDHGKAVLRGEQDFVRTNGIDLWLGGVHLEGKEAAWRWDEGQSKLVKAP